MTNKVIFSDLEIAKVDKPEIKGSEDTNKKPHIE